MLKPSRTDCLFYAGIGSFVTAIMILFLILIFNLNTPIYQNLFVITMAFVGLIVMILGSILPDDKIVQE